MPTTFNISVSSSLEELNSVISSFRDAQEEFNYSQSETILSWLQKEGNNLNLDSIKEVLVLINGNYEKYFLAESWLKKEGNNLNLDSLKEVLASINGDDEKYFLAKSCLQKEGNNLDLDSFKQVLVLINGDDEKYFLAKSWLEKQGNNPDSFKQVLVLINGDYKKLCLAEFWLAIEGNNLDLDSLKEVLASINGDNEKYFLAKSWLEKQGNNLDLDSLKEFLGLINEDYKKLYLAKSCIKKEGNSPKKFQNFATLVEEKLLVPSKYNTAAISALYLELEIPTSRLPELCTRLYPNNEFLQTELFGAVIKIGMLQGEEGKSLLKSFTTSLHDNENVLNIVEIANQNQTLTLSELEILDLVSERLSFKYESIKENLSKKSLPASLTHEGWNNVVSLFGLEEENQLLSQKTLANLFSYYDFKNEIVNFKSVVRQEVLAEIAAFYAPSSKSTYLKEEEYQKLQQLFNSQERPQSNLELPKVKIISDYLAPKIPQIPPVNIDQFQFGESEILSAEKRDEFTERFKKLLRNPDPQTLEVASFFKEILSLENEIKTYDQTKLLDFFKGNRDRLSFLLQQNGSLEKFASAIHGLGDGCVANIGTQVKIAVYSLLIEDPCDQVLFSAFEEKIVRPILNSGGDNLGGSESGVDIFQNNFIDLNLISPKGLVTSVSEQFFKDGKVRDAWGFIEEGAKPSVLKFLEESSKSATEFDQKSAQIAAYIILKTLVPEIAASRYLADLREFCQSAVR
ncbi:MAG: hypothetical protein EBS06_02390, partial [Proteobacteria bacterium]|nr:hypothetical protein [Pseudomonadota bacterium]